MTRVESILARARITLADPGKQRWDDDTLLSILSEGVEDFVEETQMLNETSLAGLTQGNPYFDVPEDCWQITRVLYEGAPLPFVTHKELDKRSLTWEEDTGAPEALIYDRSSPLESKVYPVPDELTFTNNLGVVTGSIVSPQFGVTTAASGVVLEDLYGVVTDVQLGLQIYYLKLPGEITTLDSVIDTPPIYDTALKFYVVGQAFLTDNDVGFQQKGAMQMQQYGTKLKKAKKASVRAFTRAGQFKTSYRDAFRV